MGYTALMYACKCQPDAVKLILNSKYYIIDDFNDKSIFYAIYFFVFNNSYYNLCKHSSEHYKNKINVKSDDECSYLIKKAK